MCNAPWNIDRESFIAFMRNECDQVRQERDLAKHDRPEVPDGKLLIVARVPRYLPEGVDFDALSVSGVHDVDAVQTIGRIMRRGVSPDR